MLIPSAAERISTSKFTPATAESPYHRCYFYVGGQYRADENGNGEHVFTDQMYVEQLTPIGGAKHAWPLVFIQGAGQSGTVNSSRFLPCAVRSFEKSGQARINMGSSSISLGKKCVQSQKRADSTQKP